MRVHPSLNCAMGACPSYHGGSDYGAPEPWLGQGLGHPKNNPHVTKSNPHVSVCTLMVPKKDPHGVDLVGPAMRVALPP